MQASKDSDLHEFGVDIRRDLARVAGGTPKDPDFGRFVAGKNSVSITCEVEANTLHEKCAEIVAAYKKTNYRSEFAWVDNMRLITEKDKIEKLDGKLFEALTKLRAGKNSSLHMSPPEIVKYNEGSELCYNGFGSYGRVFHSLAIEDYVAELDRCEFDGERKNIA